MPTRPAPIQAFLCERCGYGLDGLDPADSPNCPECGRPAAQSDPANRPGTRWQRAPGPGTFVRTMLNSVARPATTLDRMHAAAGPRGLIAVNAAVCAAIALVCALVLTGPELLGTRDRLWLDWPANTRLAAALHIVLIPPLTAGLVAALSLMEAQGLRILAWQRGWRFGKRLSLAVVAHGGSGWIVATAFGLGGGTLMLESWYRVWTFDVLGVWVNLPVVAGVSAILGTIFGFLLFETFAWLGLRRCRFANSPR